MKDKINNTLKAVRHPFRAVRRLMKKQPQAQPTSAPEQDALFIEYGRLARLQGFDRLCVDLSFDCDTPEDIPAAEQVHTWLTKRGLKATYAVPGAQLLEGAQTYQRLLDKGADFINHGARPHAEWRDGRYWSMTFYNEMTREEVIEDIKKGHKICQDILGRTPVGFRAPHFGYFQSEEQRSLIYKTLKSLGYQYDTATLPEYGLKNGPMIDVGGLYEFPLNGSYSNPYTILDSWNYVYSPYYPFVTDQFAVLFIETVDKFLELGITGVLNYYVDPAHVYRADAFYWAMAHLLERNIPSVQYTELIAIRKHARLG